MLLAAMLVSCAEPSHEEAAAPSPSVAAESPRGPSLAGAYTAMTPGPIASLNVYDGDRYWLRRASCPEEDAMCQVHGRLRFDPQTRTLAFLDDESSTERVVAVEILEQANTPDEPSVGIRTGALVSDQPVRLLTPLACGQLLRMRIEGQELAATSAEGSLVETVLQSVRRSQRLEQPPSWAAAVATCRLGTPTGVQWQGMDMILVRACGFTDDRYTLFLRDQTRVGEFRLDARGRRFETSQLDVRPEALLDLARRACQPPAVLGRHLPE